MNEREELKRIVLNANHEDMIRIYMMLASILEHTEKQMDLIIRKCIND